MDEILTAEEEQAIREAAYNGTPDEPAEPEAVEPETSETTEPEPEPVDPWAGVPAALKDRIEQISVKLGVIDTLQSRLKQNEQRVGAVINDLYNAQKKAQETPTPEAIERAKKAKEEWDLIKEDSPGLAAAIEERIAAGRADLPDIDALTNKITELSTELAALRERPALTEIDRLEIAFPDFRETVQSVEYKTWLSHQPPEIQDLAANGKTHKDGVRVLRSFHSSQIKAAEKKDRLKQAVDLPQGPKPKADPGEISEDAYRKKLQKDMWGS